jgi:hypothetical protein
MVRGVELQHLSAARAWRFYIDRPGQWRNGGKHSCYAYMDRCAVRYLVSCRSLYQLDLYRDSGVRCDRYVNIDDRVDALAEYGLLLACDSNKRHGNHSFGGLELYHSGYSSTAVSRTGIGITGKCCHGGSSSNNTYLERVDRGNLLHGSGFHQLGVHDLRVQCVGHYHVDHRLGPRCEHQVLLARKRREAWRNERVFGFPVLQHGRGSLHRRKLPELST